MEEEIKNLLKNNSELLEKNIKLTKQVLALTTKTQKYLFFQQILGILKIVVFVGPIVIGIIYLPPLLQQLFAQYKGMLSGLGIEGGLDQLAPELLKYLK